MRGEGGVSGLKVADLCSELQASLDYLTSSCSKNKQTKQTNSPHHITLPKQNNTKNTTQLSLPLPKTKTKKPCHLHVCERQELLSHFSDEETEAEGS